MLKNLIQQKSQVEQKSLTKWLSRHLIFPEEMTILSLCQPKNSVNMQ